MPTYVYETIPTDPTAKPRRFEVFQRMLDDPLQTDPESGHPVRRIISGARRTPMYRGRNQRKCKIR